MLKFPSKAPRNPNISYANSVITEHIGSKIMNAMGLTAQETLLGTYTTEKNRAHIVVACKDFTSDGRKLMDFGELKNTCLESSSRVDNAGGTDLNHILDVIEEQELIDKNQLKDHFWDMFIVDALIGNWDRHNGNWGFLINEGSRTAEITPVFDCGSSLFPQADLEMMNIILTDEKEMEKRIYKIPTSAIKLKDKKINYFDFLSSHQNSDCTAALMRISSKIDMEKINRIIDETPFLDDLQKKFYKTMLLERKERIIDYSINRISKIT